MRIRLLPAVLGEINAALARLLAEQAPAQALLLASVDGRELASASRGQTDRAKLAAVASTLMSMAGTACRELGGGAPDECLVTHPDGLACLIRCGPGGRFVLLVASDRGWNIGMLVSQARRLLPQLDQQLERLVERA